MDVAEETALVRLAEDRAAAELERPAGVVEERRREEQVGTEPRMELRRVAAQGRHADRVLEEPARVRVVVLERRREVAQCAALERLSHRPAQPRVRDLAGQELEEAL